MTKYKCIFYCADLIMIVDIMNERIREIQSKESHEMSEVLVYRLYNCMALSKRLNNKIGFNPPTEALKLSFILPEVLTLKNCLMDRIKTPGLSQIFMQLDSKIHPAIQLEL